MSKNAAAVAAVSLLAVFAAAISVVLRRARTEHPPVSPTVPRLEDLS
ncbi:hypothetical protein [Gordonia hirsuta]|nr:hypothetical protein [Gordonia hirsuta]